MWGVWECEDSVHVIPCDDEGIILTRVMIFVVAARRLNVLVRMGG